jgi:DNA-binding GntR family transcriptional regulator
VPDVPGLSLADEAYAVLRRRLVRSELAPGTRVVVRDLASGLGLGITPVREALARLDAEGLVTTLPRRGYLVTPVTPRAMRETAHVWSLLAPALVDLALEHATPDEAAEIVACMTTRGTAPEKVPPDLVQLAEQRSRGWRLLAAAGRNQLLADLYGLVDGRLVRLFVLLFSGDTRVTGRPTMDWAELFARRDRAFAHAQLRAYVGDVVRAVDLAVRQREQGTSEHGGACGP